MRARLAPLFASPFLQRVVWHVRRVSEKMDRRFFLSLLAGLGVILAVVSTAVWLAETDRSWGDLGAAFYWSVTTVLGQGDASYVGGPVGWAMGWLLGLFGVAIVAAMTGALVGFVIDFLLKEGQGMGASGYRDHIVVCGWNTTARDLLEELKSDAYEGDVALIHDTDSNPAGNGVYFVRGDSTNEADLVRAGIQQARSAIVCPKDASNEADMHSILTVLAIESIAPGVRTVVEVNNPAHVPHFRRTKVDELLVTSRLAAHLLARSAIYPGLTELMTDIVSGGEGSELYRVQLPAEFVGMSIDQVSTALRSQHAATLLAVARNGSTFTNPGADFALEAEDNLVVIAESLGTLQPLKNATAFH
ncbi:MAG TPA: NAD-binding protein [Acidimicrobiia bacterium]|nr:NAD-binding protein [Acidimicrobiia bacterium]